MSATDHESKDRLAQPDGNGERAGGDTLRAWRESKQYLKDELACSPSISARGPGSLGSGCLWEWS